MQFSFKSVSFVQVEVSSTTHATSAAAGSRGPATAATTATATAAATARRVQGGRVRRLGTQHPQPADVQGHARGHARPGQRRVSRGQGDQRRGRVDQVVRRVGRRALWRVVCDCLVAGRRHFTRRVPETGS